MNKNILGSAIVLAFAASGVSTSASAALASNAVLDFTNSVMGCVAGAGVYPACTYGATVTNGTYFGMDTNGNGVIQAGERNGIAGGTAAGITLGTAQAVGEIDATWSFGGNPGNHYTQAGLAVASASGNTATINMTGWTVFWNGGDIDMGQGVAGNNLANVTCGVDCAVGDTFSLTYAAIVPSGGFAGFFYTLNLVGTIGAGNEIPVPAAAWLFGSGLLGLAGVARRRKAA
jgi:hypothetical protein